MAKKYKKLNSKQLEETNTIDVKKVYIKGNLIDRKAELEAELAEINELLSKY